MSITIKDIAKLAGVSHTTVLKALHDKPKISRELADRIKRIADEHKYVVNVNARNLAIKDTKVIGLVVTDLSRPLFSELTKSVEQIASARGYSVIVSSSDNDPDKERAAIQGLRELRVAGIIIAPSYKEDFKPLVNSGIPFIALGHFEGDDASFATFDDEQATFQATEYLLKSGHVKVACASHGPIADYPFKSWIDGYRKALAEAGIAYRPEFIFETESKQEAGYRIAGQIAEMRDRPTAIISFSDKYAIALVKGLKDQSLAIPQDMAFISLFDNDAFDYFDPPITSVRFPVSELGKVSAEYLFRKIGKKQTEIPNVRLKTELIVRGST